MKFSSSIVFTALAFLSLTAASDEEKKASGAMQLDIYVDYVLEDQPTVGADELASFLNGETAVLKYSMASRDENNVTVVGAGGTLRHPTTHEILYNLTAEALDPMISIKPNSSYEFQKSFEVDFEPANYILAPEIYIVVAGVIKSVPIRNQRLIITNVPLSLFDPQLVFLVAVLVAILGASTWFVYNQFGTSPAARLKHSKERRSSAVAPGKFDSDWIPEEHLKKAKRTKKAN
ncbi:increased recombination centers protein 22 [[Candida] railenensis]|uniref:Increased recombination centers protein 22 n=1 Tax=[Candida] railenensis TaxID=45579 RepID=A0A9P0QLW9_9ASCO|nr:increased recombination centers protein 22 [[Candida] railenensis]